MAFSSKWSKDFLEYFQAEKEVIMRCATRYKIEPWNIQNPNSGVTNNETESLINAMIKRLLEWKEVPIDCLCLSLYYLQTFYFTSVQGGMIGVSECKLRKEFQALLQDPDEAQIPKSYYSDEIFETVKMKINDSFHIEKSKTVNEKNLKDVDKLPPKNK